MQCPKPTTVVMTGIVTIDAGNDKKGLLGETRYWYEPNAVHHPSREKAITNALTKTPVEANVVGYGNQGIILTGSADVKKSSDTFIGVDNQYACAKDIATLNPQPGSVLQLCACDTGAGADGVTLVVALARALRGEVRAPTGLVFLDRECRRLKLERGAVWQYATPTYTPKKIDPPKHYVTDHSKTRIAISYPTGFEWIDVTAVTAVRIYRSPEATDPVEWLRDQTPVPLAFLGFELPEVHDGLPFAFVTGACALRFRRNGWEEERVFHILNNRVLQDATFTATYYYANMDELFPERAGPV